MKLIHIFLPGTVNCRRDVWLSVKDSVCCGRKDDRDHPVSTYISIYLKQALLNLFNPTLAFISDLSTNQEDILLITSSIPQYHCSQHTHEETEAWYPQASRPRARHLLYRRPKPALPGSGSCSAARCISTLSIRRKASAILNLASTRAEIDRNAV